MRKSYRFDSIENARAFADRLARDYRVASLSFVQSVRRTVTVTAEAPEAWQRIAALEFGAVEVPAHLARRASRS